jgi:AraC-like DNA-binding protein
VGSAAFVQSYFHAWNQRNPVAVADHLANDGTFCDVPHRTVHSHDELIVDLGEYFTAHRHHYELIGDVIEGPNSIAFQYRMFPPARQLKTGSARIVHGAEFLSLHGDAAITIHDYYTPAGTGAVTPPPLPSPAVKYAKSGLGEAQLAAYKQRLADVMTAQQIYLQPDLTLQTLARTINCSINHLSQVINAGFGKSFFDFLNQYRVEHAKGLLSDCNAPSAVLNVAFAVGFSSNSAFYAAFKKHVGQSPARYRRAMCR